MLNHNNFSLVQGLSLLRRFKRYVKVTQAVGGVAARWTGNKYFGISVNHDIYSQALMQVLGNLKGPLVKIAQLLSMIPGALPSEYSKQLVSLHSQVPSMGWFFVKRRMRAELGVKWESCFKEFNKQAFAAASLGQVHKAVTKDNLIVACKIQYPDMESIIEDDLKQLSVFLKVYGFFNKALQTDNLFLEVSERLREELDYFYEARNLLYFQGIKKDLKNIYIPKVITKLSTKRLLTMSWMEGQSLISFLASKSVSLKERNQIALTLFWAWYFPFYSHHILHGDPHLGNYTLRFNGEINLLDFGCVRRFSSTFVAGVLELYMGLLRSDRKRCLYAYEMWGFKNLSKKIIDILNVWARFLYAPLLENKVQTIDAPHKGKEGRTIISEVLYALHSAGGVRPPREFVLMDRAAVGIGAALMRLGAELNWHKEFELLLDTVKKLKVFELKK